MFCSMFIEFDRDEHRPGHFWLINTKTGLKLSVLSYRTAHLKDWIPDGIEQDRFVELMLLPIEEDKPSQEYVWTVTINQFIEIAFQFKEGLIQSDKEMNEWLPRWEEEKEEEEELFKFPGKTITFGEDILNKNKKLKE